MSLKKLNTLGTDAVERLKTAGSRTSGTFTSPDNAAGYNVVGPR